MLALPDESWGGPEGLLRAKQAFARVARAVSSFEPVTIAVRPLEGPRSNWPSGKAEVFEVPLDNSWARDIGPTFLIGPTTGARGAFSGTSMPGATNIIRRRMMPLRWPRA